MVEASEVPPFVCEWGDCQDRFRSLAELEWHVRRHIDDLHPEEDIMARVTEPSPLNSQSMSGSSRGEDEMASHRGPTSGANALRKEGLGDSRTMGNCTSQDCGTGTKCIVCQGNGEAHGNYIVLCNGCNRPYHQSCHRPAIHDAVIKDRHSKWYCKKCTSSSISSANSSLHNSTPSIKR